MERLIEATEIESERLLQYLRGLIWPILSRVIAFVWGLGDVPVVPVLATLYVLAVRVGRVLMVGPVPVAGAGPGRAGRAARSARVGPRCAASHLAAPFRRLKPSAVDREPPRRTPARSGTVPGAG